MPCQGIGRGFEPRLPLQILEWNEKKPPFLAVFLFAPKLTIIPRSHGSYLIQSVRISVLAFKGRLYQSGPFFIGVAMGKLLSFVAPVSNP